MTYTPQTWNDEVLAGEEKYTIKNSAGSVLYDDVKIELKTPVSQAGSDVSADRMNHIEQGIKTVEESIPPPSSGGDYLSTLVNTEVSITGTVTANWGNQHVVTGSTNFTINLQTCVGNGSKFMSFRILNSGITTLDGNSSETIEGATTIPCYQGQTITLYSDGSNAHVINQNAADRGANVSAFQIKHSSTPGYVFNTSQHYGFAVYQNPRANGDYFEFSIYLTKGTYTLAHIGYTAPNITKLDWTINGVSATTGVDWYSASTVYSVIKTFSLTVPYTGYHRIRATVNGRNASATDWYYTISEIAVYPAAY
jgi:hypothetical protein